LQFVRSGRPHECGPATGIAVVCGLTAASGPQGHIRIGQDDRVRYLPAVLPLLGKKAIKEWLFHVPCLFVGYVFQGMQGAPGAVFACCLLERGNVRIADAEPQHFSL
jgi:hypothetical protein